MTQRLPQRTTKPLRPATPPQRFAVHPLSLAVLLTIAGPAYCLPQGGLVVGGQATIQNPSATLQVVTQGSNKAIIDWRSFSIGAGEKVRFDQPSSTAVLLNRVTGYEPTSILGQMQSNGQIFLLNPYGVVFGANARIDVGGLVASTLSLSNSDFLASRYSLSTTPGAALGEVRNEGAISAPGGTVVLAGPTVTNTGSIEADRGRVGLAAANSVLVDVEGDGLVFFQTQATEASNRLQQLGRIRADGGSVELRAAARGSFADTVLNMGGVVQARGLGTRNGRIVIDGGPEGIARVAGTVDASSAQAGQGGGNVTVTGDKVLLDSGAALDASGAAGGGRIRVGGGWHGGDADVRNAQAVIVAPGAVLKADAGTAGNGGEVVVWADGTTRHLGTISARGGATGGDGGRVEVSGAQVLDFQGRVDLAAPAGAAGQVLLDPDSIEIKTGGAGTAATTINFGDLPASTVIDPVNVAALNGLITLQAKNTITFTNALVLPSATSALKAQAGGNIDVNASIQTHKGISLDANDPGGTQANGRVKVGATLTVSDAAGTVVIDNHGSTNANQLGAAIVATGAGATVDLKGATELTADSTITTGALGAVSFNGLDGGNHALSVVTDALSATGAGSTNLGAVTIQPTADTVTIGLAGGAGTLALSQPTLDRLNGTALTIGRTSSTVAMTGGATLALPADTTLRSNTGAIAVSGVTGNSHPLTITTGGASSVAGGTGLTSLTIGGGGATSLSGTITTVGSQTYGDPVTLTGATTLSGGAVVLGALDGAQTLAITTAGTATFGTVTGLTSLSVGGGSSTTLNGNVTTTGTQAYEAVALGVNTTLTGTSLTLGGPVTGARTLTLAASTGASLGTVNNITSVAATGAGTTTLNGNVTTTGTQSYGAVALGANSTLTGTTLTLTGPVTGARNLTLTASTGTSLRAVNNISSLTANGAGATTLNDDVTTAGTQTYGAVALGADATLTGTTVSLGAVTGAHNLVVTASGGASFGGTVTTTSLTANGTGTTSLADDVTTTAAQTYGAATIAGPATLQGTNVTFNGAVGGANALTVKASGIATFGSTVATSSLTSNGTGTTRLGGNVTTTGDQAYNATTLTAPVTLATGTGGQVDFNAALAAGSNALGIFADTITLAANPSGLATVALGPATNATTIGVDTGAAPGNGLSINNTLLGRFANASTLTIGRSGGTGTITVDSAGPFDLPTNLAFVASNATINFDAAVRGGRTLTVTNGGATNFNATVGSGTALTSVTTSGGTTTLTGNVTTSGAQSYGNTALAANSTLTGTTVGLGNLNGGTRNLVINASTSGSLGTVSNLNLLTATSSPTTLNGNVTTTTTQTYGAVVLGTDATLTGSTLTLGGPVTGAHNLTVAASTGTALGAVNTITSLAATGAGATTLNGNVTTTGTQSYAGVALGTDATLTGSTLTLAGPVTGAHNLSLTAGTGTNLGTVSNITSLTANGAGVTTLNGNVTTTAVQSYGAVTLGANVALSGSTLTVGAVSGGANNFTVTPATSASVGAVTAANFTANGPGTTTLGGDVTTLNGTQTYNGTTLSGPVTLTAQTVNFNGVFNAGANDLALQADGLGIGGTVSGTGNLRLSPRLAASSIGLESAAAADANYSQGVVTLLAGGPSSFTSFTLGRPDGTGAINVGSAGGLTLPKNFTLLASNAPITLGGTITGNAHSLTSSTSGLTSVGATLSDVSTFSVSGPASLAGTITTTGAQTYSGAVSLAGATSLTGTTIGLAGVTGGGNNLSLAASSGITLANINGVADLASTGAGTTTLGGSITTSGTQTYGNVALNGNRTLTGTTLGIGGTVSGTGTLTLTASTGASLNTVNGIGGVVANGAGPTTLNGTVATAGAQSYGAVSLAGDTTLVASGVTLGSVTAGANDLLVSSTNTTLNGNVTGTGTQNYGGLTLGADVTLTGSTLTVGAAVNGGTHSFTVSPSSTASLQAVNATNFTATGPLTLGGDITTPTGAQNFAATTLSAPVTLTAQSISLNGAFSAGANDLAMQTLGLGGGPLTGSGNFRLAAPTASAALGLASASVPAPGDLSIGQGTLTAFNSFGFSSFTFGRPDGTGAITVGTAGSLTLPSNLSIIGASAPVTLGGSINGNGRSLTVSTASGNTTVGGALTNLSAFSVTGTSTLAGSVSTTGAQTYGGTVTLAGPSTLTGTVLNFNAGGTSLAAGANSVVLNTRDVNFAGTVASTGSATLGGFDAADTLGIATATPTTASFSAAEIAKFGTTGTLTLGRAADGTGAVSVGALTLPRDTSIVASTAPVAVEATIAGAGHALTISTAGATTLAAAPTGLASLTIVGPVTLPGGTISTTGAQSYGNTVSLAANQTLDASSINFGGALNVGTRDLTLQYDAALTGPTSASGTGFVSLAPRTVGSTIGVAGGAGTFQVSQATLDSLTAFPNLGVGRADGTGLVSVGALALSTNFRLQSGTGNIQFAAGTTGGANALNIQTGGTTSLTGAFTNLASLSVTGPATVTGATTVGASGNVSYGASVNGPGSLAITSPGATSFAGPVGNTTALAGLSSDAAGTLSLGGSVTSSGAIVLGDALTLSAASTTLAGSSVDLQGSVNGSAPNANALIVNGAGGTALRSAIGAGVPLASLAVGAGGTTQLGANVSTGGGQSYAGPVLLIGDAQLAAGTVSFGSTIDGARNLAVNAAGATSFTGNVGATTALLSLATNAGGSTTLPASVRTTGAQSYGDAVTLVAAASTLSGSAVGFGSTVEGSAAGAQALTVNAAGATSFGGTVGATNALASLTTNAGGTTSLAGNVRTTGAQAFLDAVTLTGDVVATGASVQFNTSVDGAHSLSVVSGGTTTFAGTVGGVTPLTALSTNAGGDTQLSGNVTTSGAQSFGDAVLLLGDATLSGSAVSFSGTVNGLRALTVNAAGVTSFGGDVGTTAALTSLTTNAGGSTSLPGRVVTSGAQTYGDNVTLTAATTLFGGGIAFGANLGAGAFDLTTRSDALTLAGNASGSGALSFAPSSAAGSIGLGGAPGTLQLDAGLLGKLGSFAALTIGRADGTGAISAGTLTLSAPTTVIGSTAPVAFTGTLGGGGQALAVTSGGTTTVAGTLGGLASFSVPNAAVFNGGAVTTTGAQTYGGAVTLPGDATLSGGTLQFAGAIDGPGALNVATTGGTTFAAPVGNGIALASLGATGPVQVNGGSVRTTGAQSYAGALALGAATTLTGTNVTVLGSVDGAQVLTVAASGTTTFGAAVGANTALTSVATGNAVVLAGNVTTSGAQSYAGAVQLNGDATLSGTSVTFGGALDGAHALATNTAGTTTFVGAVGSNTPLTGVTVAGPTQINGGSIATTGAQSYGGAVLLGSNTAMSGSNVTFGTTLDGPGGLAVQATGAVSLGTAVGGTAALASINLAAAGGSTLNGNVTTTGTQSYTGPVTLGANVIASGSGIGFAGTVDGAFALQANSAGATTFGAPVGANVALTSLATDAAGTTSLAGNVRTSGAQTYLDATTLTGNATLGGSAVTFGSTLDGAAALSVNATATRFGGNVGGAIALTSVTTDAVGTTRIGGNVRSTGAQTYADAVVLDTDTTLTASSLTLGSTVNGLHALTAAVGADTALNGAVGATAPLTSLVIAGTTTLNAGDVTTLGSQVYTGAVTLARTTNLTAGGLSFGAALDGAQALTIQTAGATSFGASVGATIPLASLVAAGGGSVSLAGTSIDTTGAQSYSGDLQLAGNTRLGGSSLGFGGNVSGAQDLQLQTDALSTAGGVAGSGVLTVTPLSASTGIGIAGGTGALQVSQAMVSSASGFTQHIIGRAGGSGTIDAGALTLSANTTLQTGSGNINLGGATNGGFDLQLNAGGTTRIAGPVGTSTALRSLATDNQGRAGERTVIDLADASGSAQIVTSGAQTYADPVAASVPVRFVGSSVMAQQATNHFAGAVSGSVTTLALVDSGNVQLGDLAIAGGGSIQAEGTISVGGALNLGGGTLTLSSNATPTSGAFTDPELATSTLSFGASKLEEASATIFQTAGSSLTSSVGSLLVLRTPKNGSLLFDEASNKLLGNISAVAGTLGDSDSTRFGSTAVTTISVLRINSSEIHVAGAPPTDGNQALERAGLEADAIKLSADKLSTGADGQIRARLPFDNLQGSQTSLPGLTLVMSPQALTLGGGFGTADPASWIRVQVGNQLGGYLTVRPKGANGDTAVILLSGADPKPFYDGAGKLTEVRVFYNGDTPRTPQESGALNAVIALVEEARHARFEEAVRTENVSSRLRSGVIAEVGSGRPATVGRESIRMPETCNVKADSLRCE